MKIFRYLAFSALLAMSASGANAQDFDKGAAAYEAGDYQTAWKELLPLEHVAAITIRDSHSG